MLRYVTEVIVGFVKLDFIKFENMQTVSLKQVVSFIWTQVIPTKKKVQMCPSNLASMKNGTFFI